MQARRCPSNGVKLITSPPRPPMAFGSAVSKRTFLLSLARFGVLGTQPWDEEEIKDFYAKDFGVTFPLTSKVCVVCGTPFGMLFCRTNRGRKGRKEGHARLPVLHTELVATDVLDRASAVSVFSSREGFSCSCCLIDR